MTPLESNDPLTDPNLFDAERTFDSAKWGQIREATTQELRQRESEIGTLAGESAEKVQAEISSAARVLAALRTEAQGRVMSAVSAYDAITSKIVKSGSKKVVDVLRVNNAAVENLGGVPVRDLNTAFVLTQDDPPYMRSVDLMLGGALSGELPPGGPLDDPLPPPPGPPPPPYDICTDPTASYLEKANAGCFDDPAPPNEFEPPYIPPPDPGQPPLPPGDPFVPPPPPPSIPPIPAVPPFPNPVPPFVPPPCPPGYYSDQWGNCYPIEGYVPPPPPPPPPEPEDCLIPPPTLVQSCGVIQPVWYSYYWVSVYCRGCKCPRYCIWYGPTPPDDDGWDFLSPRHSTQPTQAEIGSYVSACIDRCDWRVPPEKEEPPFPPPPPPGSPPTAFPPPPPGSPPTTPPTAPPSGGPGTPPPLPDDWTNPGFCNRFDLTIADEDDVDVTAQWIVNGGREFIDDNLPEVNGGIFGNILAPIRYLASAVFFIPIAGMTEVFKWIVRRDKGGANKQLAASVAYQIIASPIKFADEWLGTNSAYYFQSDVYKSQYWYPVYLPEQADVDNIFLSDAISDEGWECWTKAHGNMPEPWRMARDAKQLRTNPGELVELWLRGKIGPSELAHELRKRGVIDPRETERFKMLSEQIPPPTQLIEFMRKGADNKANVELDGLSLFFPENYTPRIKAWANAQGVTDEQMLLDWNSHWQEISPQMAFEMYVRNRPGRVPPNLVFTLERLEKVLREADYPPGLIAYLISIAYAPITRTDLIKGNKAGVISYDMLVEGLQDVKYSKESAVLLADIISQDNDRQRQNAFGVWTQRRIATEYRNGTISAEKADTLLSRTIKDEKTRADLIEDMETLRDAETAAICIKAVKRRFMIGDLTIQESKMALMDKGVGFDQADALVGRWECERDSKAKEYTLGILKRMLDNKLLAAGDVYTNLLHLRYDPDRAWAILQLWEVELAEADRKRLEMEARRRITDARSVRTDYIREVKWEAWLENQAEKKKKKADKAKGSKSGGDGQESSD